jgi:hypothetical protein
MVNQIAGINGGTTAQYGHRQYFCPTVKKIHQYMALNISLKNETIEKYH